MYQYYVHGVHVLSCCLCQLVCRPISLNVAAVNASTQCTDVTAELSVTTALTKYAVCVQLF